MLVTRQDLEAALAQLEHFATDYAVGIHGPDSVSWQLHRESIVFLGGGKAALLQLAHPYVAYGIHHHSKTRADVLGRFKRTFMNIFAMTFGDIGAATTAARRVHNIHTRITGPIEVDAGRFPAGHTYQANDLDALIWVYATLMHTVVEMIELLVRPLAPAERDAYYQESKRFALLFGISAAQLPRDWPAFDAYYRDMLASDTLAVTPPAREMAQFLFQPPQRSHAALTAWAKLMTAGMLPPRFRAGFGFRYRWRDRVAFRTSIAALRPLYRLAPSAVRFAPVYVDTMRRLEGRAPSRVSAWVERMSLYAIGGRAARAS